MKYNQNRLGRGSKIIEKTANVITAKYPDKKGYSPRNLTYMCQFAKQYPIEVLKRLAAADMEMECPTVKKVVVVRLLNEFEITQELLAQLEQLFKTSSIASINWAAHVVLMNSKLKLGLRYWYMKQTLECGWSSNIRDIQVKSDLFQRQIKEKKSKQFYGHTS